MRIPSVTRLAGMALILALAGCTSVPLPPFESAPTARPGAYYKDDGPGVSPPANLDRLPDAVPRVEPYASATLRPYVIFGRQYVPIVSEGPFRQRGMASWYGRKFHGQRTANGEIYDMYAMTAAHPTLPIPSYVRVTHLGNGRSVVLRVNDRGPFLHDRIIDLSYAAAHRLGYVQQGSAQVEVERLLPADILAGRYAAPATATAMSVVPVAPAPAAPLPPPAQAATPETGPVAVTMAVAAPDMYAARPLEALPGRVPEAQAMARAMTPARDPARDPDAAGAIGVGSSISSASLVSAGSMSNPGFSGGYFLQLGAFRSQAAAENLRASVGQQFATLADGMQIMPASDWFRVRLGPYPDRVKADLVAQQLRTLPGLNPVIVPPQP